MNRKAKKKFRRTLEELARDYLPRYPLSKEEKAELRGEVEALMDWYFSELETYAKKAHSAEKAQSRVIAGIADLWNLITETVLEVFGKKPSGAAWIMGGKICDMCADYVDRAEQDLERPPNPTDNHAG